MKDLRRDYASRTLADDMLDPDPIAQFRLWFAEALAANVLDANAMSLATVSSSGEPSVRTVLLKDVDARGLTFFTHYTSAKGRDLAANPRAALLFFWAALERQVRITGRATRVDRAISEAYFSSRPLDSQLGAWAATQSASVESRAALEASYASAKQRFAGQPVPCPPDWGGYHVEAERVEFWQGRPGRLHDRVVYLRDVEGAWTRSRLAP
jgi:pyridoxamine 5'-phosphate oxidase